jgi:hypothetical protein
LTASNLRVLIDDQPKEIRPADLAGETLSIDLPPGLGTHSWRLELAKNH